MHPITGGICTICGERLFSSYVLSAPESEPRCGLCRRIEPAFARAVAYGSYEGGLRELIHLLKYGGVRPAADVLGRMLAEAIAGLEPDFPDGSIIARIAWSYETSEENNRVFGQPQSFVAGHPKNGVQFMVKDSRKYASTGGWGYAQFDDGKSADQAVLNKCFPCHEAVKNRDFVFTRYAP